MFETLLQYNNNKLDTEFIEHLIQLYNNYITMHLDTFDSKYIIYLDEKSNRYDAFNILQEKTNCSTLKCILSKDFIKYSEQKLSNLFLKNMKITSQSYENNQWLSNLDIDLLMNQFEYIFVNFLYTGTVLIDFDQNKMLDIYKNFFLLDDGNKKIQCFHYQKNYCTTKKYSINSIATVYNTSSSKDSKGKHWITTFAQKIDNKNIYIYFFDSLGYNIPKELQDFVVKIKQYFKTKKIDICVFNNLNIKHQFSNSECGVYAITFIKKLLENSSNMRETYKIHFQNKNNIYTDNTIRKKRSNYFKPKNNKLFKSDIYIE